MDSRFGRWMGTCIIGLSFVACTPQAPVSQAMVRQDMGDCKTHSLSDRFLVKWTDGKITAHTGDAQELQDFLDHHPSEVDYAEHDRLIVTPRGPTLRRLHMPLSQADNWGQADVNAAAAWAAGETGQGILVGVIDTGVDATHPQLKNQIAYNMGEAGLDARGHDKAHNGLDDDANGLVDDYAGYQFVLGDGSGVDPGNHGSHVGGIVAAEHHDTSVHAGPVQGIAPGAKLVPAGFMDGDESGNLSTALAAIDYAVARGARVINASWGGNTCSQALKDKINDLYSRNIAFVTASGNDGNNIDQQQEWPASYNLPGLFTIGAVGPMHLMADFSNYGDTDTHIFAPGLDIDSTVPGGIVTLSGTSMSTPFVSGAIAVLMGHKPGANLDQIRQALYLGSTRSNHYHNASHGRLNIGEALKALDSL